MSESHLSPGELIERVRLIEVWQRASERAPHKPLPILLALARLDRGVTRLATFEQLEDPWNQSLKEFGPLRANLCRRRGVRAA